MMLLSNNLFINLMLLDALLTIIENYPMFLMILTPFCNINNLFIQDQEQK